MEIILLKEKIICKFCNKEFPKQYRLDRHLLSTRGECYKIRNECNFKQIINNQTINNIIKENIDVDENETMENLVIIKIPRRKKINQNKRIKVAASQKWKCNHCEMLFNEGGWDINHILRVALGGTNAIENLEALCKNSHGVFTANERIRDGF